eukprot:TRINITY_DN59812_c0_g1_i1.p1 TRINITY_DN59812_c0_g1~~TRINITY_DN59812_c0_g1_i1.p1  ORF type:complete len:454 (-),score=107.14 TRINITY_DN59812_c0_g1_i1:98-1411(-)
MEPGDLDDDLPPLVGDDGEEVPEDPPAAAGGAVSSSPASGADELRPQESQPADETESHRSQKAAAGHSEEEALRAAASLRTAAVAKAQEEESSKKQVTAAEAMQELLQEAEEPRAPYKEPDEHTKRMVTAITKDDFEECEDAILQGADVNVDCGAGMRALHISALRGEMFLTELIIAHGADVNQRDLSGNTPLLYACHFYRQHQRGVNMVAQLLYHKANPWYRVKDGKLAGQSAHDLMDKACNEPQVDENVPRQMRAMLQLAMDGGDSGREAIVKMWMSIKSSNKKLFQVSSKKDNYDYLMKNIDWVTPENAKNAQAYTPVKLEVAAECILEEKFTNLKDYLFTDEGEKVKVYVNFPESAAASLGDKEAIEVQFEYQAFDLKLRTPSESFRLRIDPLFGSIETEQSKHRVSTGSRKVTLTLVKRHKNRLWSSLQKSR